MTMPQTTTTPTVAIGVCLNCNHVFPVHGAQSACPLCGRPPVATGALELAAGETVEGEPAGPAEGPPAAPPVLFHVQCPHCDEDVLLSVSDTEIAVVSLPPLGPVEEAAADPAASAAAAPSPETEAAAAAGDDGPW